MKIGLFGGTFDPIHWGHLRSAEEVREAFSLDRILFVPASDPPHKKKAPGASANQRVAMVRTATADNPQFAVSTVELSRPGKSYTIDTVRHFAAAAEKNSLFFIVGFDAFREIVSWKSFGEIFSLCNFIVTSRPGSGEEVSLRTMPVAVRRLFCYDPRRKAYCHGSGTWLFFFKLTDIAISSSEIRTLSRRGKSIRYLVPPNVASYIKRRGLYRKRRKTKPA